MGAEYIALFQKFISIVRNKAIEIGDTDTDPDL